MRKLKFIIFFIIVIFSLQPAGLKAVDLKEQVMGQLEAGAETAELGTAMDPRSVAAKVVEAFLGLMGMIFMGMIIVAGYWFITAQGEEEKINKAKSTILRAVIGLIIVLLAYSITYFVGKRVQEVVREDEVMIE